jgi:type 1 fimbria pilin
MKKNYVLIAFALVLVLVGSAWAAASKHNSNASGVMKMSGTVVSSSSTELVISSKVKSKTEQETFAVNPQTKTKGTLATGEMATVRYKNENGQKVATMISAHKMAAAAAKSK